MKKVHQELLKVLRKSKVTRKIDRLEKLFKEVSKLYLDEYHFSVEYEVVRPAAGPYMYDYPSGYKIHTYPIDRKFKNLEETINYIQKNLYQHGYRNISIFYKGKEGSSLTLPWDVTVWIEKRGSVIRKIDMSCGIIKQCEEIGKPFDSFLKDWFGLTSENYYKQTGRNLIVDIKKHLGDKWLNPEWRR